MDIKKFEKILLKGALGIFAGCVLVSVALTVKYNDAAFLVDGVPFFCYSSFVWCIIEKNREIKKHTFGGTALIMIMRRMLEDLARYEKLYGKLPEEGKEKEAKE